MSLDDFIANITEEDLKQLNREYYKRQNKIPTYSFSKIRDIDLKNLVDIKNGLNENVFKEWFNQEILITEKVEAFLLELINKHKLLIKHYKEEDLKLHFLSPIFNNINFTSYENEFRDFYNEKLTYKTDKFIFNGETDFVIAKGLIDSEKPYFFIQEFKKALEYSNPEPQLLAELISGVELNNEKIIKGAYIIGEIWNFVILEKLEYNKYQYFVSENFDSTKIEDLKSIYKNLLFIKNEINEIIEKVKKGD